MKMMKTAALAIAASLSLTGCGSILGAASVVDAGQEAVYPAPIDKVRQVLVAAEQPPMVFGDTPVEFKLAQQSPTGVVWTVSQKGAEVMRFSAEISPAGEGKTQVKLSLAGATGGRFGNVEERLAKSPAIRSMYLVAMQERIAADLERRSYNMSRIYPQMTAATFENMDSMMANLDAAAAEDRKRTRENVDKAYRDEAAGKIY